MQLAKKKDKAVCPGPLRSSVLSKLHHYCF
jgi:hypothetical protein